MEIKGTVPGSNSAFMFGRRSLHIWLVIDKFLRSSGTSHGVAHTDIHGE